MRLNVLSPLRRLFPAGDRPPAPDSAALPLSCPARPVRDTSSPSPFGEAPASTTDAGNQSVIDRIQDAMAEVRPAIRMDGGDIELVGFQDGVVTVRLKGACRSCPLSEVTLQLGVERVLKQLVPEVTRLESV